MHWITQTVEHFLISWGYWAVLLALLGEDAGIPLPGETTLMFASFLAHKHSHLSIYWVIAVGVGAATLGDNIGFLLGRRFGSTLIRWMKKIFRLDDEDIQAARNLIRKRGPFTVFIARFIFGLRTIAGPLAGMLGMKWKRFTLFNFLGAAAWVSAIAMAGYLFANEFKTLLDYVETVGWAMAAGLFLLGYLLWRHHKHQFKQHHAGEQTSNAD